MRGVGPLVFRERLSVEAATLTHMDNFGYVAAYGVLTPVILALVSALVSLLLLYVVIRIAVAGGLRDHYKWVERQRPKRGHVERFDGPASGMPLPPNPPR